MCVCVRVCVCSIARWLGHLPGDRKVPCRFDSRLRYFGVVVSLSKKLYSYCSSLPSCLSGDLVAWCQLGKPVTSMGTWGNKCPTVLFSLNGVEVIVGLLVP